MSKNSTKLQRYRDVGQTRIAMVVKTGRKWMQVLVIDSGRLRMVKRPLSDLDYMERIEASRKTTASLRRLARQHGTARNIRDFLRATL